MIYRKEPPWCFLAWRGCRATYTQSPYQLGQPDYCTLLSFYFEEIGTKKVAKARREPKKRGGATDLCPIIAENHGCYPKVWEVGRPKMELGEPGTVGFVLMRGTSITTRNGMIMEEMAEIHVLSQRIPKVSPGLEGLQGHLHTTCSSAGVAGPLRVLIVPFQRD